MSAKEIINTSVEVVSTSLVQAPGSHATIWTVIGSGIWITNWLMPVIGVLATCLVIYKTYLDIKLAKVRLKNENKKGA